ncbi:TetR/AcrR family transcriptional regulator [Paludifilum halophilum]|uniref:HTH tetR-type domain-containing protein n=1 Tax=Paludifilum halophilum TaxID=1642702 RepID=A0A235BAA0_9BACL|nr:TetR/AcrR family transcriptional regulator [Paludifilum halophilum]OYD08515.1 hypothetical protein CHM34_06725 [Paludifilum halophilum]
MSLSPRAQAKREQIRTAAQQLFLQHGFAETRMDAITARAGVSKQTVYSYYAGKEELLADVLTQLIHRFFEDPSPLKADHAPLETYDDFQKGLNHLAETIITTLMQPDYLALIRVILSESIRFPKLGELFRSTVPVRVLKKITAYLQQARRQGWAHFEDADAAARMFVGPLLTHVLLDGLMTPDRPPRRPDSQQIEAIVRLYLKSLSER